MTLTAIGAVFGPILLLAAALLFRQEKRRRIILIITGILFFLNALIIFIRPYSAAMVILPPVLWKFISLITVVLLFLRSARDKHNGIAWLLFCQAAVLIIVEITISPDEPALFLEFHDIARLLLLTGAFILAASLPVMLQCLDKHFIQVEGTDKCMARVITGFFLVYAAFAGLMAANSMTGLFLFWQWAYLANDSLRKAFVQQEKKKSRFVPIMQQVTLTMWLICFAPILAGNGSLMLDDLPLVGQAARFVAVVVFIVCVIMGTMIPERRIPGSHFEFPLPVASLCMIVFSLLVPFSILARFQPLFLTLDNKTIPLFILFGSLMMAANACHAGLSRNAARALSHIVLYACGWGLASIFISIESVYYSVGYIIAVSTALTFLFLCMAVLEGKRGIQIGQMEYFVAPMPAMVPYLCAVLLMFLFSPFSIALQGFVLIGFLSGYAVSLLLAVTGLVLIAAVIVRWLLMIVADRKENHVHEEPAPLRLKGILAFFLFITMGVNLLSSTIYSYLQSQAPSEGAMRVADLEAVTGLHGSLALFKIGSSSLYLLTIIILSGVVMLAKKRHREKHGNKVPVLCHYSLFAWIPSVSQVEVWIRAAWIIVITLLLGVGLSCFW